MCLALSLPIAICSPRLCERADESHRETYPHQESRFQLDKPIRFQETHTRNSLTWRYKRLPDGRLGFVQVGGVYLTAGFLVKALAKAGRAGLDAPALIVALKEEDPSFRRSDLSAPIKKLLEAGIIQKVGVGVGARYRLTADGAAKWRKVKPVFKK